MFKPCLKMSRQDVTVDHKQVLCPKSTWIGFSSNVLKPGMFFNYRTENGIYLARMHHRIAKTSTNECKGYIVAQVAIDGFMSNHCERWINPNDVIETRPADRVDAEIIALFDRRVTMWHK